MAKTKAGKKYIRINGYTKSNGTKVRTHCKSTPRKR